MMAEIFTTLIEKQAMNSSVAIVAESANAISYR